MVQGWLQSVLCLAVVAASVAASVGAIVWQSRRAAATASPRLAGGTCAPWRSCWTRVRPAWLLAFRATAAVALAAVLLWDLRTYDASIMVYYTEWTLVLEIAYFAVATLFSAYGCLMHSGNGPVLRQPADSHVGLLGSDETGAGGYDGSAHQHLQCFMQIIYQASAGAVVLTDAVFWCVIIPFMSSSHFSLNAVMCCMHSLNLLFLLTETALNTLAFPWLRIAYFVLWTCLYVVVMWIAHACGLTWWPYPFLSPAASWAPLWYLSLGLLHVPCYLVYWLISRAKARLLLSHESISWF